MALSFLAFSYLLFSHLPAIRAQSISTSTPIPPLQWINLTSLLQGPAAPPLKDASIGYDNDTRTLIIFGGESQGGLPQQQTYLLNLDNLVWASPSAQAGSSELPPPRSAASGAATLPQAIVAVMLSSEERGRTANLFLTSG
ncbi:hypothetical protein BC834DRAFT_681065 [Gloeopeniophorella convolvens]|nr:hypothetical protein BC834DRAFT_681065 [Gloeopeniophorella convolvens]